MGMKGETNTIVKDKSRASILLTIASQSSTSIGLPPSVRMTIFLVQDFFFARYLACVSIPTTSASIAEQ